MGDAQFPPAQTDAETGSFWVFVYTLRVDLTLKPRHAGFGGEWAEFGVVSVLGFLFFGSFKERNFQQNSLLLLLCARPLGQT